MKKILIILLLFPALNLPGQFKEVSVKELPLLIKSNVRVITDSKTTFQGVVYSVDEDFLTLIVYSGEGKVILKSRITQVFLMDPEMDKRSLYQDSASNRLIIMPTGFAMETGEFHVADQEIAVVTMSYGVNPNFTLWGGISIPGAVVSARYIQPLGEGAALSIGTFAGLSWLEFAGVLLPYTIFSVGSPENNFTIGGGGAFFYTEEEFSFDAVVLAIGGKRVLSDSTAIVTENWIIWGEMANNGESAGAWEPVPIGFGPGVAFRIAGEKFSWDIGAVVPVIIEKDSGRYRVMGFTGEELIFIPLPIISLTYRID